MRRIAVLDAPSNLGLRPPTATSVPGVYKAPGALRDHGLITGLHARDAGCLTPPRYDPGDWRPGDGVAQSEQIAAYSRRLADRIGAIIDAGEFPVVLGGDCSIVIGSGLAMHRLGETVGGRIGLVFVDGHSDFRHPGNASYVGAAAGEDLALVTGRGQPDLAAIEQRRPYFRDVDVVVIGIRAQDEYRLDLQAAGIVTRPVPTLRVEGAARSAQWAREQLVDCAGFWVHVDVDVLDPAVMPAVDAPSPGGIALPELELLLAGLVDTPHCLGVEITVFDPDYDPDGAYAADIASALVAGLAPARTVPARPDLIAARDALSTPDQAAPLRPSAWPRPPADPETPAFPTDLEALALPADPETPVLPADPEVLALSADPETLALSADPEALALSADPEVLALLADPHVPGDEAWKQDREGEDSDDPASPGPAAARFEPADGRGRLGPGVGGLAQRPDVIIAADPAATASDPDEAFGRPRRRVGGLAERADLISSADWLSRPAPRPGGLAPRVDADHPGGLASRGDADRPGGLAPRVDADHPGGLASRGDADRPGGLAPRVDADHPGGLAPRGDADRPGGLRRSGLASRPGGPAAQPPAVTPDDDDVEAHRAMFARREEEARQRRAAAAADSVTLAAVGASGVDPFGTDTGDEPALPATTLLGVEESDETPAFADEDDRSSLSDEDIAIDARDETTRETAGLSAEGGLSAHENDNRPAVADGEIGAEADGLAPDGLPPDGVALDGVASDRVASDRVAPDRVAPDGVASDRVNLNGVDPDGVAPDGVDSDNAAVHGGEVHGGEVHGGEVHGGDVHGGLVIPAQAVSRPLGASPELDSEPLPATRPGRLRPREPESFSLPAQRPAFDSDADDSADIA